MADITIQAPDITERPAARRWSREYPPLLTMVIALLIAFLVLPSSLNLPNSNPTTVLEFSPVPPEDDDPPPQSGSLSSLGLGSTDSLSAEFELPPPPEVTGPSGSGSRKSNKNCVGPPDNRRQTEDPNSPACVSYFDGDNGGETWQGVTADEITVLIYGTGGVISDQSETENGDTSAGEATDAGGYCDLDKPSEGQGPGCNNSDPPNQELSAIRALRALASHFENRYQTYKRHLHFHHYAGSATASPASRSSDASSNFTRLTPFAVVDIALFGGFNDTYAKDMALRNVMVFGSFGALDNRFFRENAPFVWSFWPDIEHDVDFFVDYVCNNIVPYKVSRAGDDKNPTQNFNGRDRKYAFMGTKDESKPGQQKFYKLAKPRLEACGATPAVEVKTETSGYTSENSPTGRQTAQTNAAEMAAEEVTTIIWMAGMESLQSQAMETRTYYPEIVMHGNRQNDDLLNGRSQNQRAWAQTWTVTTQLREDKHANTPARQAYRESDPNGRQIVEYYATTFFRDMFTMVRGIQVAGPRLSPQAVDQGSHAIQRYSSPNPFAAACFYDVDDYSCVKDVQVAWWDPNAADPNGDTAFRGCWRMLDGGARRLLGDMPRTDLRFAPNDACNGVKGTGRNNLT